MRLSDVALLRYGHFHERRLAFPAPADGAPDLHVVFGPNEAGKSTFRNAIVDFLFGFPFRTPFAFRFDTGQLAVAASVETDDGVHRLVRLKKNKDDLRRADDSVADPGLLAAALSGLDRAAFEREQALGHEALVEGGHRLLQDREDLGAQLFGAATGLVDCLEHQRATEAAAWKLFKADGRARTDWREARRAYDAAAKALRAAETRRTTFERLVRDRRAAEDELQRVKREHGALRVDKERLERLVRLAPQVARLRAVESAIADMSPDGEAPPPLLPEEASARVREAAETVAVARNAAQTAGRDRAERRDRLARVAVDENVLEAADEIERLAQKAVVVREQAEEVVQRRAQVDNARRRALEEARAIGRSAADAATLAARLPSRADRAELAGLEARRGTLAERAADHAAELETLERKRAGIEAALAALPTPPDVGPARAALETSGALGDVARNRAPLATAIESARGRRDAALAALAPWTGTAEALAALVPPEPAAVERAEIEARRLEDEIRRLVERVEERRIRRGAQEARARVRAEGTAVPDARALAAAREARDALWREVRDGARRPAEAAPAFEAATGEADGIADARFAAAEEATRLEAVREEIAALRREEEDLGEMLGKRRAEREAAREAWRAQLAARGLPDIPLEAFPDWLRRREEALEAARVAEKAAAELADFDRRAADALAALCEALPEGADRPASDDLASWRVAVEAAVAASEETARRRRELGERRAENEEARAALARKADAAATERSGLEERRARLAGACGLDPQAGGERVRVTLEALERIEGLLAEADRIEREVVAHIEREREAFAESAASLAARLHPPLSRHAADEIARTLEAMLQSARAAAEERTRLTDEIAVAERTVEAEERKIAETEAGLEPLYAAAGLGPDAGLSALSEAAARSDRLRGLLKEVRAARDAIAADGDGRSVDEIAAEVEAGDADERRREIGGIEGRLAEADSRLQAASETAVTARQALEAVTGGDASGSPVTRAAADRAVAAGRLAEIAADHLWAFAQARLMRWAIDRYRAENQSPLVKRAGELFAALTCGRYARLDVDPAENPPRLLAIEANAGAGRAVDALSSGTRDQLFLALRLAAADLRTADGRHVPFIADDLFVNADDERTEAGLKVLADLAGRTQIVYLTHHAHLVEIARHALGEAVNVVAL